ncbi:unnamed protein product [Dracunculus medinensis]|uniref:RGS domain-containing protein n=1 Tax=Dracunculus medinensis TaxID=318479 RepID=A0A0N4UI86_DRAME|nr:unnamed protein product [Dracunculus medinensis]
MVIIGSERRPINLFNNCEKSLFEDEKIDFDTSSQSSNRFIPNEWTYAFDKMINDENGRIQFTKFLQSEYSEENIFFWLAVQELRPCIDDRPRFEKRVQEIFDKFITANSPLAINIDHDTRMDIIEKIQCMDSSILTEKIFDRAQAHVYRLMEKDCFSRFIHTPAYKDIAKRLQLPRNFQFSDKQLSSLKCTFQVSDNKTLC